MWQDYVRQICNSSRPSVLDHARIGNYSIYFLSDCFQQGLLVLPIYLVLFATSGYLLGFFSLYKCNHWQALRSANRLIYSRYLFLLAAAILQVISYIRCLPQLSLIAQLIAFTKLATVLLYFASLLKCICFIHIESTFQWFKLAPLLIVAVTLSEALTNYFVYYPLVCALYLGSSLCWFIHFVCLIKTNHSIVWPAQLLINQQHDEDVGVLQCDEQKSYFSQLFFHWVSPLLKLGLQKRLDSSSALFELPYRLKSISVTNFVDNYLDTYRQQRHLLRSLFNQFGLPLALIGLMKLTADILSFMSPILIKQILLYLKKSNDSKEGFVYAFVLFACTLLSNIIMSSFNFQMSKLGLRVRTLLVCTIYHKLFRVRSAKLMSTCGTGHLLNLANTDVERVVNFAPSLYQLVSLPIQLVVTLYLLYSEVGLVFLSSVLFILALIPVNKIICNKIGTLSQEMMKWKDKRIKLMSEILRGISTIKMHFWEQSFTKKVHYFRAYEVKYLRWRKYLDAFCVYFWATTPVIVSSLVFGSYAYFNGTESLTSDKVFTSLALLSMLIMPLNALPWVLNGLIEALVSVRRLEHYFVLDEMDCFTELPPNHALTFKLTNCEFNYLGEQQDGIEHFKLSKVNLRIGHKSFIGIIGKVGSGKSSLLKCLLNELNPLRGVMAINTNLHNVGIGYVSQEPWIQDTSIRENITFGKSFDSEHYSCVVDACALLTDFKLFPHGDQTIVGNHGATLSGGQKARIAIARALYQNFDVYIIDEPFASVDVEVAEEMYNKCFKRMLLGTKCVILATNHLRYLREADMVFLLNDGLLSRSLLPESDILDENECKSLSKEESSLVEESAQVTAPVEEKEYGIVRWNVYLSYMQAIGYILFTLIISFICLMQLSKTASDYWLSLWTEDRSAAHAMHYLYIFIAIAIINSLVTLIRAFLFAHGGIIAALSLHDSLLNFVMKSSLLFFDLTAFGIIINRFSSDVFNVDDALPFTLNIFLAQLSGMLASLIVTSLGLPWILLIILPLAIPYYFIQKYFRATSRELKRLSAISLSPLYSQLDDTIQGLVTIRAYLQTARFKADFYAKLDVYNRIQYANNAVQQWLNLRLQLLAVVVTSAVAFIAVTMHHYQMHEVNSSMIGLSLVYSLSLTALLNGTVQTFTQTELDLISVERIMQMLRLIKDNFSVKSGNDSSLIVYNSWPSHGVIRFKNVCMRYRAGHELALNGITFSTKSAEHVAIVGRTGSGKSSLFQALSRLTNIESGSISIDGVDISMIQPELLRSNIFIIPQDPFLFSGTIRDNLDPLYRFRDDEIWTALYNCNINILVDSLGGLDAELQENGKDLSVGQRHLFCLARAVLNKKRIICMDEVTANIDTETETVLHELIGRIFKNCTVLHIAHKLESIRNFDRVIVMDAGQIVKICSPQEYLSQHQFSSQN